MIAETLSLILLKKRNNLNRNAFSRHSVEASRKSTVVNVINGDACDSVIKLAKLHGKLNDIVDDTNASYSNQVFDLINYNDGN